MRKAMLLWMVFRVIVTGECVVILSCRRWLGLWLYLFLSVLLHTNLAYRICRIIYFVLCSIIFGRGAAKLHVHEEYLFVCCAPKRSNLRLPKSRVLDSICLESG